MAQLNFYVSDELESQIRHAAKQRGLSISAYLAEMVKDRIGRASDWPPGFFDRVLGGWQGDFPDIERSLPQERSWPE